ncbi:MAG: STAS domain-containing protein [Oscillospiraceae bacterium]|nr:STAS domain-containing protein [Oscillospiraceae bacterium]
MLEIKKQVEGQQVQIDLIGNLDTNTAPDLDALMKTVFEEGASDIVLELGQLKYVSSAGLRVILRVQKKINAIKGRFVVRHPNAIVSEVFASTGFDEILTIEK